MKELRGKVITKVEIETNYHQMIRITTGQSTFVYVVSHLNSFILDIHYTPSFLPSRVFEFFQAPCHTEPNTISKYQLICERGSKNYVLELMLYKPPLVSFLQLLKISYQETLDSNKYKWVTWTPRKRKKLKMEPPIQTELNIIDEYASPSHSMNTELNTMDEYVLPVTIRTMQTMFQSVEAASTSAQWIRNRYFNGGL